MSVRTKRWAREEYDRLVAAGHFHPEARLQLIRGEIVEMTPQGPQHMTAAHKAFRRLVHVFKEGHAVRMAGPLALSADSEPEPDIAVVPGQIDDYSHRHPGSAALVVEVADSSLPFDRGPKLAVYAEAGIREYWIVNLPDRVLEIYRNPQGNRYRAATQLPDGEEISPLAAPGASIRVADLLP